MSESFHRRLTELGLVLPPPPKAVANYVPVRVHNGWMYVSGQLPLISGQPSHQGKVGSDLTLAEGYDAARICTMNILAHILNTLDGDMDRLDQCVKLTGFVAVGPGFSDVPKVVNGASDLLLDIFGEKGRTARSAVGVAALPLNVPVEIELIACFRT